MTFENFKAMLQNNDFYKYNYVKIDTFNLLQEALKNKLQIHVFCVDTTQFNHSQFANVYQVSALFVKKFTDLKTHHNFIALVALNIDLIKLSGNAILLNNVQNPGNAGCIIRTALGFGINNIYITTGSVSLKNSKFVRATEGAIFNVKITYIANNNVSSIKNNFQIMCTTLSSKAQNLLTINKQHLQPNKGVLMVFGNEAQGVSAEILALSDIDVKIPINTLLQSYSVASAASIVMFYLQCIVKQ